MASTSDSEKARDILAKRFGLTDPRRSEGFYVPTFLWLLDLLKTRKAGRPLIVGLAAPQGAGKTTLSRHLVGLAEAFEFRAVSLSIDDFYLTRADQVSLAQAHKDNPYLQQRGYPGTHDLALGSSVLSELKALREGMQTRVPRYDKSAHKGQGDRLPTEEWQEIVGPLDLVILEGWMLGFQPVPAKSLQDTALREINSLLPQYSSWLDEFDAFIWLEAEDTSFVLEWRVEAEERMKAEEKPGMSRAEIGAYIAKFLIAYRTYIPGMNRTPPIKGPLLHQVIGRDRLPLRH